MQSITSKIVLILVLGVLVTGCNKPVNPMQLAVATPTPGGQPSGSGTSAYSVWLGGAGGTVGTTRWALGAYTLETTSGNEPEQGGFSVTVVCPVSSPEGNASLLTLNMESNGFGEEGDINLSGGSINIAGFTSVTAGTAGHMQFDAYNNSGGNSKTITLEWGNSQMNTFVGGGAQDQISYTSVNLTTLSGWNHYSIAMSNPNNQVAASVLSAIDEVIVTLSSSQTSGNAGDVFIDNLQFTSN